MAKTLSPCSQWQCWPFLPAGWWDGLGWTFNILPAAGSRLCIISESLPSKTVGSNASQLLPPPSPAVLEIEFAFGPSSDCGHFNRPRLARRFLDSMLIRCRGCSPRAACTSFPARSGSRPCRFSSRLSLGCEGYAALKPLALRWLSAMTKRCNKRKRSTAAHGNRASEL